MIMRYSNIIALCLVTGFSANVVASDISIYRWVDENNVVHFSQQHPKGSNFSQLTTVSSYKAAKMSAPTPSTNTETPSVDEQLSRFEKEKAEVLAKNEKIAEKNCEAAKLNKEMLNTAKNVMLTDANGKNKTLSAKEKKSQLALSEKHISLYCKPASKK